MKKNFPGYKKPIQCDVHMYVGIHTSWDRCYDFKK
jgi:hypothetical protein